MRLIHLALVGAALFASADAFVPSVGIALRPATPAISHRRAGVCSTLNMGMGERIARLFKANVNDLLNKAEDPEKMLDQIVVDMQKELVEFRQTYAEVAANTKRLEKQKAQADGLMEEWLKRAKLALEKGDETAARAALERKNQAEENSNSLKMQLDTQGQAVSNLFNQMQMLEQKISEAKAKKDQLKARAQTAKVTTKINDMMSKTSSTGALEAFNRMEDKVETAEAEAEVAAELSGLSGDSSLDKQFKLMESSSKIDDDLAALKGSLAGAKETKSLTGSPADPKLDDELQKMKDQLGGK
eukprot:CAMPEP_0181313812 /NCGR_PEP_ID=MMETSP1101-20121128/14459_1 /TAXON_ID=46948 /ORGANISM="Rhodomonas abbreviata, Strain Caron Lab Isolate" /LENGTH=300 /DNA_ID=CAMNT_0023420813 /DNA_START=46 /DNA_END=948 /DNA_ORIENTATION=+